MSSDTGKSGSLSLHPLVLMNVSDHLTRFQLSGKRSRVFGMLFGCQSGLSVHIYDSFELEYSQNDQGQFVLDKTFVQKKCEHFVAVFPTFELLGWYTFGSDIQEEDMVIHRSLSEFNESPLLLLINPEISPNAKELPVKMFEAVLQVIQEVPTMIFVDVDFQIQATEPERITAEQIIKGGRGGISGGGSGSSLVHHLEDLHNSVAMLTKRMRVVEGYLKEVKAGRIAKNHATLCEISSICAKLPVMDSSKFQADFVAEMDDTALITYLSTITKAFHGVTAVQEKVVAYDVGRKKLGSK